MIGSILKRVIGTKNERELKTMGPIIERINGLEAGIQSLDDGQLRAKTDEFRKRLAEGEALDDVLPEAFAVVREGSRRTLRMRHFDVQLVGGLVLHRGTIAEMKTGEGKTLAATLPVYLNALSARGVHVVTVNDYLAKRDAEWMGTIYEFLGLTVGTIVHERSDRERHAAYRCDVTYGTNNEFGFDYLRDNMKFRLSDMVQRDLHYAIVDEVDSILVDEARTPLIISGPTDESTEKYAIINSIIPRLVKETDYVIDEKARTASLTDEGIAKVEKILGIENLYEPDQMETLHHVHQGLKAHTLFHRDVEYMVKDGEVVIVDEFTGRLMPGRRWSEGLHQAVEAKEGVKIANENQTLASITFQNYFRMYGKLAGMTGTAETEASEFGEIYNLDVMVIPTHLPMIRVDNSDVIYQTVEEKFQAAVDEIEECRERGQPVLVGTISVEKSERLSALLRRRRIPHNVLNAKYHEREAEIVAQAGRKGAVTIATNMAGRGTDILLGGNPEFMAKTEVGLSITPGVEAQATPEQREAYQGILDKYSKIAAEEHEEVIAAGGLHIIGTERHESRRIDNQLRGRSGRQGDPGSSRFYLALEDDLLRIFGSDRIAPMMQKLGMQEGEAIEHKLVSRAVENAQKRVEGHNFDIRKHLLEYDNVMNKQRTVIYEERRRVLGAADLGEDISTWMEDGVEQIIETCTDDRETSQDWDLESIGNQARLLFGLDLDLSPEKLGDIDARRFRAELMESIESRYKEKEARCAELAGRFAEINYPDLMGWARQFLLETLDSHWKDHLLNMDHLKEGIGLRGYGQRDPKLEYQKEGFTMFEEMLAAMKADFLERLFKFQPPEPVRMEEPPLPKPKPQKMIMNRGEAAERTPVKRDVAKVGRNEPCTCGSGKKFKKCHGR
ncbi:MAG: preprotein translocase subunit SecA [Deltaproteobacteria bacterium]|nr:preprotein translocase subunit SecA [Deltaproteobacteria bacterium]